MQVRISKIKNIQIRGEKIENIQLKTLKKEKNNIGENKFKDRKRNATIAQTWRIF